MFLLRGPHMDVDVEIRLASAERVPAIAAVGAEYPPPLVFSVLPKQLRCCPSLRYRSMRCGRRMRFS